MKLFTIVTICYNCKSVIRETIESVIAQDRSLYEYIIIDGHSSDGTLDVVNQYVNHIDLIVSEPDKGIYDAMNKGISHATGKYINFMNAGDSFFSPTVLTEVSRQLDTESDVIFGDKSDVRDGVRYRVKAKPFYEHMPLHQEMGFNHQCVFVSLKLARKYPFDLKYKLAADYDMIINIYKDGGKFQQLDMIIANFDLTGASNTKRKLHMYERLCIDYPNRLFLNKIISTYRVYKYNCLMFIKRAIFAVAPQLVYKNRERKKEFKRLDK